MCGQMAALDAVVEKRKRGRTRNSYLVVVKKNMEMVYARRDEVFNRSPQYILSEV